MIKKSTISASLSIYCLMLLPLCVCPTYLAGSFNSTSDNVQRLISIAMVYLPFIILALALSATTNFSKLTDEQKSLHGKIAAIGGVLLTVFAIFIFNIMIQWANSPATNLAPSTAGTWEIFTLWLGGVVSGLAAFAFVCAFTFRPKTEHES